MDDAEGRLADDAPETDATEDDADDEADRPADGDDEVCALLVGLAARRNGSRKDGDVSAPLVQTKGEEGGPIDDAILARRIRRMLTRLSLNGKCAKGNSRKSCKW